MGQLCVSHVIVFMLLHYQVFQRGHSQQVRRTGHGSKNRLPNPVLTVQALCPGSPLAHLAPSHDSPQTHSGRRPFLQTLSTWPGTADQLREFLSLFPFNWLHFCSAQAAQPCSSALTWPHPAYLDTQALRTKPKNNLKKEGRQQPGLSSCCSSIPRLSDI